jgi:hypothetical protein
MISPDNNILLHYFELLDHRRVDDLVEMFALDGTMITKGGTGGTAVQGHVALRDFFMSRGPATSQHILTSAAQTAGNCFAEGIVRPLDAGEIKYFLASALLNDANLIVRYTTLVWTDIDQLQEHALVGPRP